MKKIFILTVLAAIIYGCRPTSSEESSKSTSRFEISAYKETEVILKDTMQVRTAYSRSDSGRMSMYDFANNYSHPHLYLNSQQFAAFESAVWLLVKDPKSKVYRSSGKPVAAKELSDLFKRCDSIEQISYDPKGNEERKLVFVCDSTSLVEQINKIVFFESWYFNPTTNLIERDLLGYSIWAFMLEKEAWQEVFMVFSDEESYKKVQKYRD
ncbi:MAG: hypothetical protein JWO32_1792 [Bacteroidetes bacterium]|jgi:hypothetical protein|nr:hypothetical protein [Bacteroidota bacterium]